MDSNLRPLLQGETLKNWLGDNFENGSKACFSNKLNKIAFSNCIEERVHFQTVFEKIPQPVGAWFLGPGPSPPGTWPPGGVIFSKNNLKKDHLFKIV